MAGCGFVLHVASPFPASRPRNEYELIVPAREGALRVLRAARDAGVERVVLTSSFAAIGYGHPPTERTFTEEDWTELDDGGVSPYVKSKTLAERAAWDFVAREGGALELSVVNPVGVFGPVLGPDLSSSIRLVKQAAGRRDAGCPAPVLQHRRRARRGGPAPARHDRSRRQGRAVPGRGGRPGVDQGVCDVLRAHLGEAAARVPTREVPDSLVRALALVNPEARGILPDLGKVRRASNEKARRVLGWEPRSNEEAILATAQSLMRLGLVGGVESRGG